MCSVILTLIFLSVIVGTHSVDVATCSNGTESKLTFTPHNDGVVGRYLAEMCLDLKPNVTSWKVTLTFHDKDDYCKHPPLEGLYRPGKVHSTYEQTIIVDGNCSHVCLNTTFDLIFSACYSTESFFMVNGYTRQIVNTYFEVKNNYTKDDFMQNKPIVDILNHDEQNLTIVWHTGVPFIDFDVLICKLLNSTVEADGGCWRAGCVSRGAAEVRCRAALAPGCYELLLTLHAAWTHGTFRDQGLVKHTPCPPPPPRWPPAPHNPTTSPNNSSSSEHTATPPTGIPRRKNHATETSLLPLVLERPDFIKLSLASPLMMRSKVCTTDECFLSKELVYILKILLFNFTITNTSVRYESCIAFDYGTTGRTTGLIIRRHSAVFCFDF